MIPMIQKWLDEIEQRAAAIDKSLEDVCDRAGVNRSTIWRWQTGKTGTKTDTIEKVDKAIDLLEAEAGRVAQEAANG